MKKINTGILAGLLVGVAAFAYSPYAKAAEPILEAESMTRTYGSQSVWRDSTASGGQKRILWSNGAVWGNLKSSGDFSQIDIRAKGDHFGSTHPKVNVSVNGKYVKTIALDSESWKVYSVTGNWTAGSHVVYLEYTNDYSYRGVILDSVVSAGVASPAPVEPAPVPAPTPTPTPTPTPDPAPAPGDNTGGTGGAQTDQTFLSYSNGTYTSRYHLYAAGLDWSKPVGAMIYADGSGEWGLKNPGSTYLLSGTNGLIATAKRHNMILITPFSPNTACSDGDGSCWYLGDSAGYTKWAESLVHNIYSKYPIDKSRVAFGGYSSGAQLATSFWTPSGAAQRTMTDGVVVAISYGGAPRMTQTSTDSNFKSKVHFNWNTGDKDEAYTRTDQYGVKGGYNSYTQNGYATSLDVIPNLGHDRSGQFGNIMDAQIRKHVN